MHERCESPCNELTRLESRFDEYEAQNRSSHQQIYDRLRDVEMSDVKQNEQYSNIEKMLDNITRKVDEIQSKPAKRWETMAMEVIKYVVLAAIGYFLAMISRGG